MKRKIKNLKKQDPPEIVLSKRRSNGCLSSNILSINLGQVYHDDYFRLKKQSLLNNMLISIIKTFQNLFNIEI
uniref:Uncharacterized protein n=1 Tax=Romanomermis culicivorax TaxID=13658 RepID=A0A915IQS1_ROMCU